MAKHSRRGVREPYRRISRHETRTHETQRQLYPPLLEAEQDVGGSGHARKAGGCGTRLRLSQWRTHDASDTAKLTAASRLPDGNARDRAWMAMSPATASAPVSTSPALILRPLRCRCAVRLCAAVREQARLRLRDESIEATRAVFWNDLGKWAYMWATGGLCVTRCYETDSCCVLPGTAHWSVLEQPRTD